MITFFELKVKFIGPLLYDSYIFLTMKEGEPEHQGEGVSSTNLQMFSFSATMLIKVASSP